MNWIDWVTEACGFTVNVFPGTIVWRVAFRKSDQEPGPTKADEGAN